MVTAISRIRSLYKKRNPVKITFDDATKTQQHFKNECDINAIMDKYQKTGILGDPLRPSNRQFQFGDFTSVVDFHTAQMLIVESKKLFEELPSRIRRRFNNEPSEFLAFFEDPENLEEAVELGLVEKPKNETSVADELMSPPSSGGETPLT